MAIKKINIANPKTDLRRGIDHIGVSAVAIVHDGKGRILLQKRGPNARDEQGNWDAVGGAVEFGETLIETITRELFEEIGVIPKRIDYLTTYDAHRNLNGIQTHWIAIAHAVLVDPKTVKNNEPDKIAELGWFDADSLPSPLHSQFPKVHPFLIKHRVLG